MNKKLIKSLKKLQSDTYILMLKTHNFHWNVEGPFFQQLHLLFQSQYTELFTAVDEIAERIRSIGDRALGTYKDFQKISNIKDSSETKYKKMLKELVKSNLMVVETAKEVVKEAQASGDEASADLAIERINIHEKNIWMLKSHLK